jgi:alginate O-acetyltransferase complex protein AlgI
MWYLQIDTLGLMLGFSILYVLVNSVALRKFGKNLLPFLVIFDLFLIAYVSEKLALFYAVYALTSYGLIHLLQNAQRHRRFLFVAFCVVDIVPFLYVRTADFASALPVWVTLIGFSYNMLKALDGLFYVYYSSQRIKLLPYVNFLLFFPVITGGPIFRYRDFIKYYDKPQMPTLAAAQDCFKRVIRGLFKKLVLVSWLQECINVLLRHGNHFYLSFAMVALCYAILYVDLSGYSDIAIAVGTFLGVPPPENFKQPLQAATFTQFWRRWHVTLSDWIREHIFVVVNGKRLNKYLSALIGMCTMLVMAAWHGFNRAELICGVYLGLFLALENIFGQTTVNRRQTNRWVYAFRCGLVAFFFGINAMFYFMDMSQVYAVLGGFFKL